MAKVFNLTGDVSLEDVNFSSTAARVQKNFDAAVANIAKSSRDMSTALDGSAGAMGRFDKAAAATGAGMRQFRAGLTGLGPQLQDFAVQVGSGQSAMTAFIQQAPQALSAFGAMGGVIGTAVAVAGALGMGFVALSGSTSTAEQATENFKAAQDAMKSVVDASTSSVRELQAAMENYTASEQSRAIFSINDAITAQETALRGVAAAAREALDAEEVLNKANVRPDEYAGMSPDQQETVDLARELVAELAKIEAGGTLASEALTRMRAAVEAKAEGDDSLTALNTELLQLATNAAEAETKLAELNDRKAIAEGRTPTGPLAAAEAAREAAKLQEEAVARELRLHEERKKIGEADRIALRMEADAARAAAKERERLADAKAKEDARLADYHASVQREIKQQQELAAAYEAGGEAVAEVTARHKAQQAVVAVVLSPEERAIVEELAA